MRSTDSDEPRPRHSLNVVSLSTPDAPESAIGFGEFVEAVRKRLGLIILALIGAVTIAAVVAILWLQFNSAPVYMARTVVVPNKALSATSSPTAGFGFGSLIGLVGAQNNENFNVYLRTHRSNILAERLMEIPGLPQHIFGGQWDEATGTWHPPRGAILEFRRALSGFLGGQPWAPPDAGSLAEFITNNLVVVQDRVTLITELRYEDASPEFAEQFLTAIHSETENLLRAEAELRTRAMIRHLGQQLANVTVTEHRAALVALLSESEKQLMLLDPQLPYAAVVIDPVSAGPSANMPRPLLTLILVVVATGMLVLALALWLVARDLRRRKNSMAAIPAVAGPYA